MSQAKKRGLGIIFLLAIISFFMFGCNKSTPVEDIYFDLGESEQIVLIVGQTLEMKDYVSIRPAYATNKGYSISSFNEEILEVQNNKLVAIDEGTTQIKVVASDNSLKQDVMTVVVKKTITTLNAPRNLSYDENTQTLTFNTVPNAASYTLKINNQEINLGNSNIFNLNDYQGKVLDALVVAQVKANAPTYTYALEDSAYSEELKVYQAGGVENIVVKNGVLTFNKLDLRNNVNIYIDEELIVENTNATSLELDDLDEKYAGQSVQVKIETIISDEIKTELGEDVFYFGGIEQSQILNVLDVPVLKVKTTKIEWQNIAYVNNYAIYIDGIARAETSGNSFDLKNLTNFNTLISSNSVHEIKVVPVLENDVENVIQTGKESYIKVQRLAEVDLICSGANIAWQQVDNASVYAITLIGEGANVSTSTSLNYWSMKGRSAGNYLISVQAIASEKASDDGVYYISSLTTSKEFSKQDAVLAEIKDYVLNISNFGTDTVKVVFDNESYNQTIVGEGTDKTIDLYNLEFEAGEHTITLTRIGGENVVDSNDLVLTFTQLEKITQAEIENGVLKITRSDINKNAKLTSTIEGAGLAKAITIEADAYSYNTTIIGEDFLSAGDYTTKIYAYGDGGSTFSYRESGEVVECISLNFSVLEIPSLQLTNSAEETLTIVPVANTSEYNIYTTEGEENIFVDDVEGTTYNFTLESGNINYAVQAKGNGSTILNSAISSAINIVRLKTPELIYNNETEMLTIVDENELGSVLEYVFTDKGEIIEHDFATVYKMLESTTLTLQAIANISAGKYYLDSGIYSLTLIKISNEATIELDEYNNLVITPKNHVEEYDIELEFGFGTSIKTLKTSNGVLSGDGESLNYSYSDGIYVVELIDGNYNAVIKELTDGFTVKAKFIKSSTENDELINSEQTAEVSLNLIKLNNETQITVNTNNQIVINPIKLKEEYGLTVKFNNSDDLVFVSNGTKLVGADAEFDYVYQEETNSYIVDVLDASYSAIINELTTNFTIQVKYTYSHNGIDADLDSDYCSAQTISVLPIATIARSAQNLVVTNVKETYTYANYALMINDSYLLPLEAGAVSVNEGKISFSVDYVYNNTPSEFLKTINSINVVVLNVENSNNNPTLSIKGTTLYIEKAQELEITSYKYNNNEDGENNNSVVVKFNAYTTEYSKTYNVNIYQNTDLATTIRFSDTEAQDGVVSFNLDNIQNIEGEITIKAFVVSDDSYGDTNIEVFNSSNSNELTFIKVEKVTNLTISNSKLTFAEAENVVGYEIYKLENGGGYTKINTSLVTTNEYTFTNISGEQEIVVKAISIVDGYTNSSYSESIKINKIATPIVEIVDGKFHIELSEEVLLLLANNTIKVVPEIINGQAGSVAIDLNNLDSSAITLKGTTLVVEPYLFLTYNSESLLSEDLSLQIRVEYTTPIDDVYYLNSDIVEMEVYGLHKPTKVTKTTNNNDTVELITWTPSLNNIISGTSLEVGYIFKIEYITEEQTYTYYSNDTNLKYYNSLTSSYSSYSSIITDISAVFPAGYGYNAETEEFTVKFEAGLYKVSIQAVPANADSGYNLCGSAYTEPYEFEILAQAELSVFEGKLVWDRQEKASKYSVTIYEADSTTATLVDSVEIAEYDFSNQALNKMSGVFRVVVKAISTREDTLNGKESEAIYVYRLPEATDVHIDDGKLIISATLFFSYARIEFVDTATGVTHTERFDHTAIAEYGVSYLGVDTWKGFTNDIYMNYTFDAIMSLSGRVNVLDGRDYTINVVLEGNSNSSVGIINSSKTVSLANFTAKKLKPNATEVESGVIQFYPDSNYATISADGTYKSILSLNYKFNEATASTFWKDTTLYKIKLTYADGEVYIYAVDYYSLTTAIANGTIASTEYEILETINGLYATVKYAYTDSDSVAQTLYFNVYKENKINLRDYDYLEYYSLTEDFVHEDGVSTFTGQSALSTIYLGNGGSYSFSITVMGGDSTSTIGHLTSGANKLKTFVRYGVNQLTTKNGIIQFNSLLPIENEKEIDNPVYKIIVTTLNTSNSKIFYLYHSTEEDAIAVAKRHDASGYASAIYLPVEVDETDSSVLYFDLSPYIDNGTYKVSIRTLAGLGTTSADSDYLLNAKEPSVQYTTYKLTATEFTSSQGTLIFAQSYITQDSNKLYNDKYEITIYDSETETSYIYVIDRLSSGVQINDSTHVVTYTLPSQIATEDGILSILENKEYQIKVRAMSADNYVLNGTYKQADSKDITLTFIKSQGISETVGESLRVEDGMLKWKVLDPDNYTSTVIQIEFLDENSQANYIYITAGDVNKVVEDGVYKYHYYKFTDEKYNLSTTGSVYINSDTTYTISAYLTGKTSSGVNILNSNYSSKVTVSRLKQIPVSSIITSDGILTWEEVANAASYTVTLTGTSSHEFNVETNSIDISTLGLNLAVGEYLVKVKANGNADITSMLSNEATGFVQLGEIDASTIEISYADITWEEVPNAQGYKVIFDYTDTTGIQQQVSDIVEEALFTAPTGVKGKFTITITAMGVGEGKVFNGEPISFTSSSDAPIQVTKFEFDVQNSRFVIEVNASDFLSSDELLISYNFAEYISSGINSTILKSDTIKYQQTGRYEEDGEVVRYFYPITIMGSYTNISVQVVRPQTVPSNAVQTDDINFNLFAYGAGTEENPYRIGNATQLLNIDYFTSANYVLTSSINMSEIDVEGRLANIGAVVANNFNGVLNGNNFAIFGFNVDEVNKTDTISLSEETSFALFKTLNGATIKNLIIGEENIQLILVNTFANNPTDVINLSLIATGANNSTIDNIKVLNFKVEVKSSKQLTSGSIYVGGLVKEITNSTVSNSTIYVSVNIDAQLSTDVMVYIGGISATASSSNVESTNITFKVESNSSNMLNYVGGVVASYVGVTTKSTGITNTNVEFTITNVQSIYVGGLVAFARYINIESSETTGTYTQSNIWYNTYIGGLVGYAQSSNISNSGSFMELEVYVSSDSGSKYIGEIVGFVGVINNVTSQITNCYSHIYSSTTEQTTIDTTLTNNGYMVIVGMYGSATGTNITVTGCYKKEQ